VKTQESIIEILGKGIETILNPSEFKEALGSIENAAFGRIFTMQNEKKLKWVRSGPELQVFSTQVSVKNGEDRNVVVPVTLTIGNGALFLEIGQGVGKFCRNSADSRVKLLYKQITGVDFNEKPHVD
jgi:hypothetical protein